jgi:hypothetical protein
MFIDARHRELRPQVVALLLVVARDRSEENMRAIAQRERSRHAFLLTRR